MAKTVPSAAIINLRPYQHTLIELTRQAFRSGFKRPLAVLPCGAGKTVCFAHMASRHRGYVWFLVHRRELIDQTVATFDTLGVDHSRVFIGMITTALKHSVDPTLIIFDEAHHASATMWQRIIERYPDVPVVGLTATPTRLDGRPLGSVFDTLIDVIDAETLISQHYLAPFDYFAPTLAVSLSDIPVLGSDYNQSVVADRFIDSKIYGDVARYIDPSRKTIIYAPTVAFSQSLAISIPGVVHFDGNTPTLERDGIIQAFRNGDIRCLTNVDLIGEGFDVPDCDTVILLRPTQSLALYIQQSMRALRYQPGKRAIIYDMVGNAYRHGMPTEPRQWSLSQRLRVKASTESDVVARQCERCLRVYAGSRASCPYCQHDNGKTPKQIEQDKQAELQRITEIRRAERKQAWTLADLHRIERERGYKPGWAYRVYHSRRRHI